MCEDKKYNGWENWETWIIGLYIDGNYTDARDADYYHALAEPEDGHHAVGQRVREAIEEQLDEAVDGITHPMIGLIQDAINGFLSSVNWSEIGEKIISDREEGY